MTSILAGLGGGLVATLLRTIATATMGDGGPPPTAGLVAKLRGGTPEEHAMPGMAVHVLYGVTAGAVFAVGGPLLGVAALAGAAVHALAATPVWYVVAWSIPGVLIGGTVGTRVGKYVPSEIMEPALGVVFGVVGAIVLGSELLV